MRFPVCALTSNYADLPVVVGGIAKTVIDLCLMLRVVVCERRTGGGWCDGSSSFIPGLRELLSRSERKAFMNRSSLDRLYIQLG